MYLFGEAVHGWRKTGTTWLIILWILTVVLFALFIDAYRSTGALLDTTIFVGSCDRSSTYVLLLRLAINVIATIMITSSTFFLQLLTAPSRSQIDQAHGRSRWLNVGVLSPRNLLFMPWWRTVFWVVIVLLSLPYHLLFNSAVYGTDAANEIVVLLASEGFMTGGDWFLPGIGYYYEPLPEYFENVEVFIGNESAYAHVSFNYSALQTQIASMAQSASTWERLGGQDCYEAYNNLSSHSIGLSNRQNLIIVLESPGNSTGWEMSEIYNPNFFVDFTEPPRENDTLYNVWFTDLARPSPEAECCTQFFPENYTTLQGDESWTFVFQPLVGPITTVTAKYCLSQLTEESCQTVVSIGLLLALSLCALTKTACCSIVLYLLWHTRPLSTIGDAVESFICSPDVTTKGMCTFGQADFGLAKRNGWHVAARQWKGKRSRAGVAVPPWTWASVYVLSGLTIVAALWLFCYDLGIGFWSISTFGASPTNPDLNVDYYDPDFDNIISNLVGASLIANLPQMIISLLYILFYSLVARLSMAREWAQFSSGYRPLRVTTPQGQQLSSYFLQIPLLWALPMQIFGIVLHVLGSNALYLEVSELVSWDTAHNSRSFAVRWSMQAILSTICITLAAILIPVALACVRLPGAIPVVGHCSAAISAACHVLWDPKTTSGAVSMRSGIVATDRATTPEDLGLNNGYWSKWTLYTAIRDPSTEPERRVRGKLKWGVVSDSMACYGDEVRVGHLSFGTQDDSVGEPINGAMYAGASHVRIKG